MSELRDAGTGHGDNEGPVVPCPTRSPAKRRARRWLAALAAAAVATSSLTWVWAQSSIDAGVHVGRELGLPEHLKDDDEFVITLARPLS